MTIDKISENRRLLLEHCLTFADVYEDYPFDDDTANVRHQGNQRIFALFIKHNGQDLLNLKLKPYSGLYWRSAFASVIPGYHMNKVYWSSVILDGTIPDDAVIDMIAESYALTRPKTRNRTIMPDNKQD